MGSEVNERYCGEELEIQIELFSVLSSIFFFLISDIAIDHVYIETGSSDKVSS